MTENRKIAIYLRLSIEDDVVDGKISTEQRESNSISNQRKMLLDHISNDAELREQEVAEFCDDGFSGTNMDRPGMQEESEVKDKQQTGYGKYGNKNWRML